MNGYSKILITAIGVQLKGENKMKYVIYALLIFCFLSCKKQELIENKIDEFTFYDTVYSKPGNFKYHTIILSGYMLCDCINLDQYKNLTIKELIDSLDDVFPIIDSFSRFNIFESYFPYFGAHFYYTKNTQIFLQFFLPNEVIEKVDTIDKEFILNQKNYRINQFIVDLEKARNVANKNRPDLKRMLIKHDSIHEIKIKSSKK